MRLWIQAAEMSFLRRGSGLMFSDRVKLGVEPLLLHVDGRNLRWFGYLGLMCVSMKGGLKPDWPPQVPSHYP